MISISRHSLPISLTPAQKRAVAARTRELEHALSLGRKGRAQSISLAIFLKEARKRYPSLSH